MAVRADAGAVDGGDGVAGLAGGVSGVVPAVEAVDVVGGAVLAVRVPADQVAARAAGGRGEDAGQGRDVDVELLQVVGVRHGVDGRVRVVGQLVACFVAELHRRSVVGHRGGGGERCLRGYYHRCFFPGRRLRVRLSIRCWRCCTTWSAADDELTTWSKRWKVPQKMECSW